MIKNCIFDIGGVLVNFRPNEVLEELGITGTRRDAVAAATFLNPRWAELDRGVVPERDVMNQMIAAAPESARGDIRFFFEKGKESLVRPFAYAAPWLADLHARGYKVYLLSNYPVSFFELHSRNSFPFLPSVDGKIVSGYVKVIKPDPAIYRILLETFALAADECVFIDDVPVNVRAAEAAGIHGIPFTSYAAVSAQLEQLLQQ